MNTLHSAKCVALVMCVGLSSTNAASLRVVTVMNRYNSPGGIVEGSPGTFYFSTGAYSAVVSVTSQGTKTILTTFPPGYNLQSQVVSAADGRFYSIIELSDTPANVFSVNPASGGRRLGPTQDYSGFLTQNLPDATLLGEGASVQTFLPYLLKADLLGVITPIYQYPSGARLPTNVIYGRDASYYGVYYLPDGSGYLYKITRSATLTTLYNFPSGSFAGYPSGIPVVQATDGNLYGTTPNGGANGTGTIYKFTPSGEYTLLYAFPKNKTSYPTTLIEGSDGNLYGATNGQIADGGFSLLFRITPSGQYATMADMNFGVQGACPCSLTQGSDGQIYGTALSGGFTGGGTVFALDVGLPKPAPHALEFQPTSGPVGTKVRIWGGALLAASSVTFNGVPGSKVYNSGPNYVFATVPPGATSGPIAVTTPGGTSVTKTSFTVQ